MARTVGPGALRTLACLDLLLIWLEQANEQGRGNFVSVREGFLKGPSVTGRLHGPRNVSEITAVLLTAALWLTLPCTTEL